MYACGELEITHVNSFYSDEEKLTYEIVDRRWTDAGTFFVRHILSRRQGHQVVNFDQLTYAGNLANLQDVAVDIRLGSPCFGRWVGMLLSAAKGNPSFTSRRDSRTASWR